LLLLGAGGSPGPSIPAATWASTGPRAPSPPSSCAATCAASCSARATIASPCALARATLAEW